MKVKICGITSVEDARTAAEAGADAIGLVFADSPRRVSVETAGQIVRSLPPFVTPVGLFVDTPAAEIRRVAGQVGLHAIQLHGEETAQDAADLATYSVIKAVRVRDASFVERVRPFVAGTGKVAALLLDAYSPDHAGGTGKKFDWHLLDQAIQSGAMPSPMPPIILAGGLTPENVKSAIRRLRPWAVDVSSGVEIEPGRKDPVKVQRFIANAKGI